MFKHRLANVILSLGLVFALGLVLGIGFPRWRRNSNPPVNTAIILKQVQTLSELVTVKYVLEKVEVLEDPPQNPLLAVLPDDTHVTLIAHGIIKAGVDLSQIKSSDIQVSGKKITFRLPRAQITDAYLDDKLTQVVERNKKFWRPLNKDLEQTARQNAVDDIRRAARTHGILKEAEERAQALLTHLCHQLGFENVEFKKQ